MSVLVEGMDMPTGCISCDFCNPFVEEPYCRRLMKRVPKVTRLDNCPFIEVPEPHGRLIDADKLKSYWEPDHSRYFDADHFIHTIDVAQTIIPASEDEIDEAQRDYQAAADYQQYCETYEQTYAPETGAM